MTHPERKHIIVNHSGLMPPLRSALEARGLVLDDDHWLPSDEQLEKTLACHVWFYDCLRHPVRVWRLKRRLSRHQVPLFAWNRDAPHYLNRSTWRLDWLDRARLLDIYASHTLIDERRFADTVLYLPNAADTSTYRPDEDIDTVFKRLRNPQNYQYDVSFFGGMDGLRYKEDAARQNFFAALGKRLSERNIRFLFRESEGMSVAEQIKLIHSSRINLNFGARCEYQAPVASGLPERCYGIPACGGFLLCDKRTHARDDFTLGDNWTEFDGLDDCVAKIEFWLAHFEQARDLAERCHHHVMSHHTYAQRAATLHLALSKWTDQNARP
ncbi:MAG: glycosyltransferase [Betaproteobacteria bacterium]